MLTTWPRSFFEILNYVSNICALCAGCCLYLSKPVYIFLTDQNIHHHHHHHHDLYHLNHSSYYIATPLYQYIYTLQVSQCIYTLQDIPEDSRFYPVWRQSGTLTLLLECFTRCMGLYDHKS